MMSKKKKDKVDEPKKTKASSKKVPQDVTSVAGDRAPVATTESAAALKPRRAGATGKKTAAIEISPDGIALRAYYIAEQRRRLDLPGDELGDWVEAERQLRKEARKKSG